MQPATNKFFTAKSAKATLKSEQISRNFPIKKRSAFLAVQLADLRWEFFGIQVRTTAPLHRGLRQVKRAFAAWRGRPNDCPASVKRVAEARGEDYFTSRFDAIYAALSALRAWAMRPMGIVFDMHHEDKEVD